MGKRKHKSLVDWTVYERGSMSLKDRKRAKKLFAGAKKVTLMRRERTIVSTPKR
jgi:hypothetical protein